MLQIYKLATKTCMNEDEYAIHIAFIFAEAMYSCPIPVSHHGPFLGPVLGEYEMQGFHTPFSLG
jgi:hypothetical protein